jgi:N-sulfoglucosamine sulfohydrolase
LPERPNILQIICHDLGRQLGCYDRPTHSPGIDRLAAEGVQFDRYFVCAPQCSPSRAALISGRHPHRTGVLGLVGKWNWQMDESVPTIGKTLAAAGYATWLWGFQHEHPSPAALGYQHDPIGYQRGEVPKILADYVGPRLCDWLESKPAGPWFCSVGFYETHLGWPRKPATARQLTDKAVPPYLPDSPELRQDMLNFDQSLHQADRNVERILETLDRTGQAENTVVIFTTDHGLPLPRAKCDLRDAGLEAALLMRWPDRLAANRRCNELLSGVDLMPTLLEIAGEPIPAGVDGESFAGLLTGGTWRPREAIFAQQTWHSAYRPLRSIRTHRHKLIQRFNAFPDNGLPRDFFTTCASGPKFHREMGEIIPPRLEFFDLAFDPCEVKPHIASDVEGLPPIGRNLYHQLHGWMHKTEDPLLRGPVPAPDGSLPPDYTQTPPT